MTDIAIIGAMGQLGSACCAQLKEHGCVLPLDVEDIDITVRSSCHTVLDGLRPSVIVNCAAYTAVDRCEEDLNGSWKLNALAPFYLAEWASRNGSYLIHVSTDYVFDGQKPLPEAYTEMDLPAPVSYYGHTKLAGERFIQVSGARHAILRTAWLYSETGKNFIKTIVHAITKKEKAVLHIVDDQYGSPTSAYALADQIGAVIHAGAEGLFHATAEGETTWYHFAETFIEQLGLNAVVQPCDTSAYPTPAVRPANSCLENMRLKEAGCHVMKDWKIDLKTFLDQYKEALLA